MVSSSFGTKFHLYMLTIPQFISEVQLLTKSRLNFPFIISTWIANQYLKFNMSKTELWIYLQSLFSPHIYLSVNGNSSFILPVVQAKILGIILDSSFIHPSHSSHLCLLTSKYAQDPILFTIFIAATVVFIPETAKAS